VSNIILSIFNRDGKVEGRSERHSLSIGVEGLIEKLAVLKFPRQCPLDFLVKSEDRVKSWEVKKVKRGEWTVLYSCRLFTKFYRDFGNHIGRAALGRHFDDNIGRNAFVACSAMWNLP
jgi:hypothetical protein